MNKSDLLPILAAFVIALLVIPFAAMPVNAATPTTKSDPEVVTIPEDDLKRNTGVMVLGLPDPEDPGPAVTTLTTAAGWYKDSMCTAGQEVGSVLVGPEVDPYGEPIVATYVEYYRKATNFQCVKHSFLPLGTYDKLAADGMDLLSQHKILATLDGVPTTPTYLLCEIIEKEKAKIPPPDTKTPSKRQFPDELLKTTLKDVTSHFVCKFRWIKPGVGALDVYFVGPRVEDFIADHMLIVTVGYKVGKTTLWASELQDICILGWSMGENTLQIKLFENPGSSTQPSQDEYFWSWDDALGPFASCDEAALWQRAFLTSVTDPYAGWPFAEN